MKFGEGSVKATRRAAIGLAGAGAVVMAARAGEVMAAGDDRNNRANAAPGGATTAMAESNAVSLEDRAAIEAMLLHIFWLADHGHLDQVADFHTEDALVTSNAGHHMAGREAIREDGIRNAIPAGAMTRHIMTALQITPNKDGTVETTCSVLRFSRSAEAKTGMCLLEDSAATLVRAKSGAWLISRRHVDILFPLAPGGGPPPPAQPAGK
jgi:ketosteroid isomerase-like protein